MGKFLSYIVLFAAGCFLLYAVFWFLFLLFAFITGLGN